MGARNPVAVLAIKTVTTFYRRLFFVVRALDKPIPHLHSQLPIEMRLLTPRISMPTSHFGPTSRRN